MFFVLPQLPRAIVCFFSLKMFFFSFTDLHQLLTLIEGEQQRGKSERDHREKLVQHSGLLGIFSGPLDTQTITAPNCFAYSVVFTLHEERVPQPKQF